MNLKTLLTVVSALAMAQSFALTDVVWKTTKNADNQDVNVSGTLTDGANWTGDAAPVSGTGAGRIKSSWEGYTITLPTATNDWPFTLAVPYSGKAVIDATGNHFMMGEAAESAYDSQPFKFLLPGAGNHCMNFQSFNTTDGKKGPIISFDDAVLSGELVGNDLVFTQTRGSVDIGHVYNDCQLGFNCGSYDHVNFAVTDGAKFRFYNLYVGLIGKEGGRILVDGAGSELIVSSYTQLPGTGSGDAVRELVVTNGGRYSSVGPLQLNVASGAKARVTVTDNGVVDIGGALKQTSAGEADIDVSNGGKFVFNTSDNVFGNVTDARLRFNVHDGGTLGMTGAVNWPNCAYQNQPANGSVSLAMSDSTWEIGPASKFSLRQDLTGITSSKIVNFGEMRLGGLTSTHTNLVDFSGSDFTSTNLVFVGGSSPAHLILSNGTYRFSGKLDLAKDGGSGSTLEICEGADVAFSNMTEAQFAHHGGGTESWLLVSGGRTTFETCPLLGSTSQLNFLMSGGEFSIDAGMVLGGVGQCQMDMSGGIVTVKELGIGYWQDKAGTTYLRMTGGEFNAGSFVHVADGGRRRCELRLDGGVLRTALVCGWNGSPAAKDGAPGWAMIGGNGGVLQATGARLEFLSKVDEARLGPKGLTITSDFDVGIGPKVPFSDAEDAAGEGLLVYAGSGVKTFSGTAANAVTAVAGGTLLLAEGASADTQFVVTNNAVLSLAGANAGFEIKGLTLGDATTMGTLVVDPGDTFTVTGPLSFPNGAISFTSVPADADYDLFVVDKSVELPDETVAAWERMLISAGRTAGKSYQFLKTTDGAGNAVLRLTVAPAKELTDVSVWEGPGDQWTEDGNWQGGKPGTLSVAEFSSDSAPKAVELAADAMVGALDFKTGGYVIAGDGSLGFTDSGNAAVVAESGANEIDVAMVPSFALPLEVGAGASLEILGRFFHGGLVKTGEGHLALGNAANDFRSGLRVEGGKVSVTNVLSLGRTDATLAGPATLSVADPEAARSAATLVIDGGEKVPSGVDVEGDLTFDSVNVKSGDILKLGGGRLAFETDGAMKIVSDAGNGGRNAVTTVTPLDKASGVIPTSANWYGGITVAEGELLLKGLGDGAVFTMNKDWRSGLCATGLVASTVTIDHATVKAPSTHGLVGWGLNPHEGSADSATLNVVNGAWFDTDTIKFLRDGGPAFPSTDPIGTIMGYLNVSGASTLETSYLLSLSLAWKGKAVVRVSEGSRILAHLGAGMDFHYAVDVDFDGGSVLAAQCTDGVYAPTTLTLYDGGNGQFAFRNGSRLYLKSFSHYREGSFKFLFDGGIWNAGAADVDWRFRYGDRTALETTGAGLTVEVPEGFVHTFHAPITGEGPVVKSGAGTLAFARAGGYANDDGTTPIDFDDPVTAKFTGGLEVREGAVDFCGTDVSGLKLSGAGMIANAVLSDVTIDASAAEDWTVVPLAFGAGVTTGRVKVDYGRTAANPLSGQVPAAVVVATYAGTAPDVSKWRLVNTGVPRMSATFEAVNGEIIMHPGVRGMLLLLR